MSVTSRALEQIRRMIIDDELGPGDRLPPEPELAEQLGVSRGSLREAVRALSHANLLDVRRGDGTYVTALEPSELMAGLMFAMELVESRDIDEVLEVRRLLFPPAAALAAQRITSDQLERMRALLAELEVTDDVGRIGDLHLQFGELIFEATGNAWLVSILRALHVQGDRVRRAWLTSTPERREVGLAHQRLFLDAFERGDAESARSIAVLAVEERRRFVDEARQRGVADDLFGSPSTTLPPTGTADRRGPHPTSPRTG